MKELLYAILLIFALSSCGGPAVQNPVPLGAAGTQLSPMETEYEIRPGDQLGIKFFYNPELNEQVFVRPDGRISLQLVNDIEAAGLTPSELQSLLTKRYTDHLQSPEISVIVNTFGGQKVFVTGEVDGGGIVELTGPITAFQAISESGGFLDTARRDQVVVLRRLPNTRPFPMVLNIENVLDGTDMSQDVFLRPYDIVYVPKSPIANVNVWMEQYLTKAILVVPREISYWFFVTR
jgi:polysaccharide biosynthesis/export protein